MSHYSFTERVRAILARSREEAERLQHEYVGTEHILLGLLHDEGGVATEVLENLGVDRARVAAMLADTVRQGTASRAVGRDLPYTSRAKKVLELAMSAAREMQHAYIGSEHLLIGLLDEERGIAAQALVAAGVGADAVRAETLRLLGTMPTDDTPAPPSADAPRREPTPADHALEATAWARLAHALDVTARLGAAPTLSLADDGALLASLGPDLVVRVEFPPHVGVQRRDGAR